MKYSGDIYVFDFDDTLAWCNNWYDEAILEDGCVIDPGGSISIANALKLLKPNGFKLQMASSQQLDNSNFFFQVIGPENEPMTMERLEEHFSVSQLKKANIEGNSRHTDNAAVVDDFLYYREMDSVGPIGIHEDMMDLYREKAENAVILTARVDVPGMGDKINEVISESAPSPKHIYMQPLGCKNSGKHKGKVLVSIANEPEVNHIYFYDDNLEYIKEAHKVIDENDLAHKITIEHVSTKDKPSSAMQNLIDMVNIANRLDEKHLHKQADIVDNIILSAIK